MSFNSKSLKPPTAEQKRRWDRIAHAGCVCCLTIGRKVAPEIHHLTVGGKHGALRLGHDFTIGLCPWHHRGRRDSDCDGVWTDDLMEFEYGPSLAKTPRAFRNWFGPDDALLKMQNELIRWTAPPTRERARKNRKTIRSSKTLPRNYAA